jgi:hypothetical protein
MTGRYRARFVGRPEPSRPLATGRRDCFTGEFPSGKPAMGLRMVAYEGILVREFMALLEDDSNVVSYREAPPPFAWDDGNEGGECRCHVAVTLAEGRRIAVLVHHAKYVRKANLPAIVPYLTDGAIAAGYDGFELWTEREIHAGNGLANALLVASERGTFVVDETVLHTMRNAVDRLGGHATVRELRIESNLGAAAFRAVVKLIAAGELVQVDRRAILDDHALVEIPRR